MKTLQRRTFLSLISSTFAGSALLPVLHSLKKATAQSQTYNNKPGAESFCWLDVCAPLVIEDRAAGIESDIVLTSDNFIGARGYADSDDATEYEIYLYDAGGKPLGADGVARRLTVPAMHTTVIPVAELLGAATSFWGGMKIRLRPKTQTPTHASDLFSSAFVRWRTKQSFANVHANPDPLQWQRSDSFFYSMPFPPLADYDCVYSIFNPYAQTSVGAVTIYDPFGAKLNEIDYELRPHASLLLDLRKSQVFVDAHDVFNEEARGRDRKLPGAKGGTLAVTNESGSVKNFGYLLIKQAASRRFSVEHPIHQPPYNPVAASLPFDSAGRLKAKNVLYTPLAFSNKKIGGITLQSRFHLSSGAPMEEALWLSPFITDNGGNVVWQMGPGAKLPASIPERQLDHGVIKLRAQQSCILDCSELGLGKGFSGGLSLAIAPLSNHTLMKVELVASEWDSPAFTHFRPGLASARSYQKPQQRTGLGTDYITTGARFERRGQMITRDEIIGVMNIDDKNVAGNPTLEIFSSTGLLTRVQPGKVPPFACCHYLLSELVSGNLGPNDLTLRLVDDGTTLLMSIVHVDYDRRDIAADHGSDRFSTFSEFTCNPKP